MQSSVLAEWPHVAPGFRLYQRISRLVPRLFIQTDSNPEGASRDLVFQQCLLPTSLPHSFKEDADMAGCLIPVRLLLLRLSVIACGRLQAVECLHAMKLQPAMKLLADIFRTRLEDIRGIIRSRLAEGEQA